MGHEERSISFTAKACSLHCAYWYLSKRDVAENNKFLCTISSYEDGLDERVESHRRLAIYENVLLAIKEVHKKIASISTVRSLLCTGPYQYHQYEVPICTQWKLLRVLDAVTVRFYKFPVEALKLILLRYLALTCNANLPPSISRLWNLEFLIVHQHYSIKRVGVESYLPVEIWDLQELEHLEIMGRNLPKRVVKNIPKLEKLRTQIEFNATHETMMISCFDHICSLHKLKSFHSAIINPTLLRPPPPLKISSSFHIKKLTLSGFGYPWEDMSKIVELRELQVLKLQQYAFRHEIPRASYSYY